MNANNDNEISRKLSAYLDGELNEADIAEVDEALGKNPELTRELRQLKNTREMLRNLPKAAAPDGFAVRVTAAAKKRTRKSVSIWFWRFGIAAAVIIAAVTTSYYPLLVERETSSTDKIVQQYPPAEKIGEIARDLKADNELDFSGVKKKISAGRPPAMEPGGEAKPDSYTLGFDIKAAKAPKSEEAFTYGRIDESRKIGRKSKLKGTSPKTIMKLNGADAVDQRLDGKSVVTLAALNRRSNNESVWTDNMEVEKKNVEKMLVSNGLQIAPETQEVLESNQVMNLSSNKIYISNVSGISNKDRPAAVQRKEVEYLVYGTPEQVSAIRKDLRGQVQMRQRVSQLPEGAYRHAIVANADSSGMTPAEDADKDKERLRVDSLAKRDVSRGKGGVTTGITSRPTRGKLSKAASLQEAPEATPKPQIVMVEQKKRTRESRRGGGVQQMAAMMITLRYRPLVQLNPRQADAITNLELLNRMPLSQKQNVAAKSSEMKKASTSKPATEPSAK